jgi:hypothetical protein
MRSSRIGLNLAVVWLIWSAAAHAESVRTVMLLGDPVPDLNGGEWFDTLYGDGPVINSAGHVSFTADLKRPAVPEPTRAMGLWSEGSGVLRTRALTNTPPPGMHDDWRFTQFDRKLFTSTGQTFFRANVTQSPFGAGEMIVMENGGAFSKIERAGDQAPGLPPGWVHYTITSDILASAGGRVAFSGDIDAPNSPPGGGYTIWTGTAGALNIAAHVGDPAPGTGTGVVFDGPTPTLVAMNASGQILFNGDLTGTGVTNANRTGTWLGQPGSATLVARQGNAAPGFPAGATYSRVGINPSLSSTGHVAFAGMVSGGGVTTTNDSAIWAGAPGSLAVVVREGDSAPGTGGTFASFDRSNTLIDPSDHIAFFGTLRGTGINSTNDNGIWSTAQGLQTVVREGQQAPGLPVGASFLTFDQLATNSSGQVAFMAEMSGLLGSGIFAEDRHGNLRAIAAPGLQLEVAPNDFRTVDNVAFIGRSNSQDGRPSGFNDSGHVAFEAYFTDGSGGVFVSNLVAVPEPAGGSLLVWAALLVGQYRRRLRLG